MNNIWYDLNLLGRMATIRKDQDYIRRQIVTFARTYGIAPPPDYLGIDTQINDLRDRVETLMRSEGLDLAYNQVKNFHIAFEQPVANKPKPMSLEVRQNCAKWCIEEVNEFLNSDDIVGQVDGCLDLIYFALGNLVVMGVEPQELFTKVHLANMNKLFPDGKPRYRDDFKLVKPEGWTGPEDDLIKILFDQIHKVDPEGAKDFLDQYKKEE